MCLPDFTYNAVQCTIFTFEEDEVKFYNWMNFGTTDIPEPTDPGQRLKDFLWHDYLDKHPEAVVQVDQEMIVKSDTDKTIKKEDGKQVYNFVAAYTNIHWNRHLEATFYAENDYNSNRDWLDQLRRGEHSWEGKQFIAIYSKGSESGSQMSGWVTVRNCQEGTECDDTGRVELVPGYWDSKDEEGDEGSSTDSLVKVWRFIEDMWMEDAASSLACAAITALVVSTFHF